jgi:hypothetical protein
LRGHYHWKLNTTRRAVAPRNRELTTNTPKMESLAVHKNMLKLKRNRKNHHNYCKRKMGSFDEGCGEGKPHLGT